MDIMDIALTIIRHIFIPLWIIGMYEVGKNHLNPDYFTNWKAVVTFILILAIYTYASLFGKDPETGYSPDFDLDFFLKVFVPSVVAILTGLYLSKKK